MNKRGITLVAVMVAVVIMIIFATTVTIATFNILNDSKRNKFAAEIAFIQEAVNNYYDKNDEYPISESINVNLSNVSDEDRVQFNMEDNYDSNLITLYEVDLAKLGQIDLIYGNATNAQDIYAVSKKTGKVYYLEGVSVGNTTYFTLTDELKKLINYVDTNEDTVTKDGISFVLSTIEWTNNPIVTKVLVPSDYTNITIVAKKNETNETLNVSDAVSRDHFYEYSVNEDVSTQVEANYSILVSYKKDGVIYNQTYSVTNFDNEYPVLNISDKIELVSKNEEDVYRYVRVENQSDALSGVKYIKYERENIADEDAVIYFKNNGIELQSDIIEIDNTTKYITVYIEDNAGNYTLIRKSL